MPRAECTPYPVHMYVLVTLESVSLQQVRPNCVVCLKTDSGLDNQAHEPVTEPEYSVQSGESTVYSACTPEYRNPPYGVHR